LVALSRESMLLPCAQKAHFHRINSDFSCSLIRRGREWWCGLRHSHTVHLRIV
jgi:hypothetical protein